MADHPPSPTDSVPLLINVKQVGKILGVSVRSVWRLLSEGKIVPPVRLNGAVRWRRGELERWIAEGCPPPERPRVYR